MELLKKVLFILIPISTLLIACAYGISLILGTQAVTYLTTNATGMTIFDFKGYLQGLSFDNFSKPFDNLTKAVNVLIQPIERIKYNFSNLNLKNFFKGIANIGYLLVDLLIFILDFVMAILQIIILIIAKAMNLFGIKTSANIGIFNAFRAIINFVIVNGIYL